MDWRIFFNRIKFSKHIIFFLSALILTGLIVIYAGGNSIISAGFIYLLGIIISYLKSMGLLVLLIEKRHDMKCFIITDNIAGFIIMLIFGYKYISILEFTLWAYISYALLWSIYILVIYMGGVKSARYYLYYINKKLDDKDNK